MHCHGFFRGILITVIDAIVACGGHFVRCCQSLFSVCVRACVCVCMTSSRWRVWGHAVSRGTPKASNLHHGGTVTAGR